MDLNSLQREYLQILIIGEAYFLQRLSLLRINRLLTTNHLHKFLKLLNYKVTINPKALKPMQ